MVQSSSSSLTYDLLAAVDDGDLVNVTKLLKTPGLSINSTNKVSKHTHTYTYTSVCAYITCCVCSHTHSMEKVHYTLLLAMED